MNGPINLQSRSAAGNSAADLGAALRRFVEKPTVASRCELCSAMLMPDHEHLVEPAERQIWCACLSCAVLFGYQADTRYRRVPKRVEAYPDFSLSDFAWSQLEIPINLAFFFRSTPQQRVVAIYPSAAGATESQLNLDTWEELLRENPVLSELESDVETLLANRLGKTPRYYRAPIDECYRLVGLIRMHWRGFSGGSEVWKQLDRFFHTLDQRAIRRT